MKIKFLSLKSGSSGNCYYLGTEKYGILIDAGISLRDTKRILSLYGINTNTIYGVVLTHDHYDHIKGVISVCEKLSIPTYSTREVLEAIPRNYSMHNRELSLTNKRYIEKEKPFDIFDFHITAFDVPHDGTDNMGYCIEIDNKVFTFANDLGEITEPIAGYIKKANYLIIEANYDKQMLVNGNYKPWLKDRILENNGHLCNDYTADFLANNYTPNWRYIWLGHISANNNTEELAYNTVRDRLATKGIIAGKDVGLCALGHYDHSKMFEFE
jgi:phosphoribosyl 1,2-cyclic phosphodiesterase